MNIYIVSHYYDNGESYEDYQDYQDHYYFSSLKMATAFYWDKVDGDYEGKYTLVKKTLNTQEEEQLEYSEYLPCSSCWDNLPPRPEAEEDYQDDDYDYCYDEQSECYVTEEEEEYYATQEYLNTPGTNYNMFKEIDEEIQKRKEDILINDLNKALSELLNDKC